jgi:hypothetical protein
VNGPGDTDSSSQWLLTLVAFWSTVLLTRILEVWLVALGIIPGIFIRGRHVHHFVVGFALILLSPLMRKRKTQTSWLLLGGLGLVTDEFLFWAMFEFDYWSLRNLLAVIATGTVLAVVYQRQRTGEWTECAALDDLGDLHQKQRHENPALPLASVVVPAYKEAKNLPLTLASLLNQEFKDFELIVVDNGSTDKTTAIAKDLGARVIGEDRRGIAHARQAGFLSSKGGIIVTTDADTVVPPDWLSRIVKKFREDTNLVAIGGRLPTIRQELPSRSSLAIRVAALALLLVYVFSYGNVALARSRRNVVAGGKHAATRVVSIGHNSLAKHLRHRH